MCQLHWDDCRKIVQTTLHNMWTSLSREDTECQSVRRKLISNLLTQHWIHKLRVSSPKNRLFTTTPPPNIPIAHKGKITARLNIVSAAWLSFVMSPPLALRMWNTLENEHWMARRWRTFSAAAEGGADATNLVTKNIVILSLRLTKTNNCYVVRRLIDSSSAMYMLVTIPRNLHYR